MLENSMKSLANSAIMKSKRLQSTPDPKYPYEEQPYELPGKGDQGLDATLYDTQEFAYGFLEGASFLGSPDCVTSMEGTVYYGFLVLANRNVYLPSESMKAVIYTQKTSEQISLVYT